MWLTCDDSTSCMLGKAAVTGALEVTGNRTLNDENHEVCLNSFMLIQLQVICMMNTV